MILAACLTVGLFAWLAFIYVQFHFGDRPTSPAWFASMTALGVFEYGKGLLALIELGEPALPMAVGLAVVTGIVLFVYQTRISGDANHEISVHHDGAIAA